MQVDLSNTVFLIAPCSKQPSEIMVRTHWRRPARWLKSLKHHSRQAVGGS